MRRLSSFTVLNVGLLTVSVPAAALLRLALWGG